MMSGIFWRGGFLARAERGAREGATRGASPSILRKWGGQGASPRPSFSSRAAISSSVLEGTGSLVHAGMRSPTAAKRAGMVKTVKSAGSQ